jgi:pyruvate formate lyase activating enzyme
MVIGGLQKLTLIDYPGKLACTVFLSSCNFRCPWCYSSELVLAEKIKDQPKIAEKDFFDFLEEKKGLIEGVVLCGGEPTLQKNLPGFIKKIKKTDYVVKLDTNGSNPNMLKSLIDNSLIDYVAMDIKLPKERYKDLFLKVENIDKSIGILKKDKIDYEFRTTVVPGVHKKEDFLKIANWIGGENIKYYLQRFRPEKTLDPSFEKLKPYPEEHLGDIKKAISPFFKTCEIR